MKLFCKIATFVGVYFLIFVFQALANGDESHAPGEMHNDAVTVDPMLIIIPVVVILGGIIIWKVMFGKKKAPAVQSTNAQTETPKVESQPSQPENLEIKK